MPASSAPSLVVRNLRAGESLPPWVELGMFFMPKIDPNWVWLIDDQAILIGGEFHGIAVFWRLEASDDSHPHAVNHLLKQAVAQLKDRGYTAFFTFLSGSEAKELKLARLIQRYGGQLYPVAGFWGVAPIK